MKVAFTLLTLATVAISATQGLNYDQTVTTDSLVDLPQNLAQNGTNIIPSWAPQVRYFSALARGFIQGFRRGMYKDNNYRVSNMCFDKTTQSAITSVLDSTTTFSIDWNSQL